MANEELVAASETVFEIVSDYARDLGNFTAQLQDEAAAVASTLSSMNNYWDGQLYDDFARNIKSKLSQIATQLSRAEALRETLVQTAQDLREFIETMRAASET